VPPETWRSLEALGQLLEMHAQPIGAAVPAVAQKIGVQEAQVRVALRWLANPDDGSGPYAEPMPSAQEPVVGVRSLTARGAAKLGELP